MKGLTLNAKTICGLVLALGLIFGLSACSFEKPQQPTWDTDLVVPLISHNYDMLELVDRMDEENLSYDSLGNISISIDQTMDTVSIDAGLTVDGITTTYSEKLGSVEINSPTAVSQDISLSDYVSLGEGGVVPSMTIQANKNLPEITEFNSVTIETGSLIITATNNFGLNLDSANIGIVDISTFDVIGLVRFPDGIQAGAAESGSIDLAGKTLYNRLSYSAFLYLEGDTLLTLADKSFSIEAGFSPTVTVSSANARISSQSKSYGERISFANDNDIESASVSEGQIEIRVTNATELPTTITVNVAEFKNGTQPLNFSVELSKQQNQQIIRSLAGYTFTPLAGESDPSMDVELDVSIAGSGSETALVSATDSFAVEVAVTDLEFSSVTGVIAPTDVTIDPVHESVDIPTGFENFNLTSAVMTLEIYSAVSLPTDAAIHLEGNNGQELDISATLNGGSVQSPGKTTVVVDDLSDFLNPIPSSITLTGTATVGDGVTSGTVTDDAFVYGKVSIVSPLKMSIGNTTFDTDINKADLDDIDDDLVDRLHAGTVHAHLTNHLPLEASVTLYLKGDTLELYDNPDLTIGPVEVGSAILGANGLVSDSVGSDFTTVLTSEDLQILSNETIYIGQMITFPGTNGETVKIISSDYINVQAYMEVSARMGDF